MMGAGPTAVWIQAVVALVVLPLLQGQTEASPGPNRWLRVPDEQLLYEQIMGSYVKWVRPVLNFSQPIQVRFAMRLNQIVSLDERQQVLTTNVFIDQTWTDLALAWDPAEFKDVRALRIPADQVWRPDTFIYNNADNGSTGFLDGTFIQIRHTGAVSWPVPVRLRSSCVVKITYFPFDHQYCMVRFGSWIYSKSEVDYEVRQDVSSVDLSSFTKNSEWELLAMRLEKAVVSRTRGYGMHPHLTAVIYLKRNTFFYLFNIIVPCCMLSILTLMTFWLPPTSCEKVTLGLNVFLAFSMFMLLIAEEVPASSDAVPLIGIYLCVVMTMTSISVLCAVLVTNLHNRGSKLKAAPRWLVHLFIDYFAKPMRVNRDIQLLASTIYLPEHSQFFFLHDDRWTLKHQRARSDSEPPTIEAADRSAGIERNNEHKTHAQDKKERSAWASKGEPYPKQDLNNYYTGFSSHLPESDRSHCGDKWLDSWDRRVWKLQEDEHDRWNQHHNIQVDMASKENGQILSEPGHLEMLQLRDADRRQTMSSDTRALRDSRPIFVNQPSKDSANNLSRNHGLYQESSLCGRGSSVPVPHYVSDKCGTAVTPKASQVSFSDVKQNAISSRCQSKSTATRGKRGAPGHTLPSLPQNYQNKNVSISTTEKSSSIPCTYTDCCDENDEEEVWVLRNDFNPVTPDHLSSSDHHQSSSMTSDELPPSELQQVTKFAQVDQTPRQLKVSGQKVREDMNCGQRRNDSVQDEEYQQLVLKRARVMIAEWCIIAKVVDRILFLLCLFATLFAYIFILIVVPLEFGSRMSNVTFVNSDNTGRYQWSDFQDQGHY